MLDIYHDKILILDFGSQYTQLIARRLREIGVYCELVIPEVDEKFVRTFKPRGIILSGGPESVKEAHTPRIPTFIFELGLPLLGICYGMQAMAQQLGGRVESGKHSEFGYAEVDVVKKTPLIQDVLIDVWMSHGDQVTQLPENFTLIAQTINAPIAAMADEKRQFYGVQFHPEVTHTQQGKQMLTHFVRDICRCDTQWTTQNIIADSVERIQQQVGQDDVLVALSGGVDSAVTAALVHRAVGDRLTCVFVDNGLLRHQEGDQVLQLFHAHLGMKVIRVDAHEDFLTPLKGVFDPEKKRKICGAAFIRVFEREAKKLKGIRWLAQGTIYPDVIESAAAKFGKAHVIKSHHNVGGLPEEMSFQLIEPLRELFKDEVRHLGVELGLPKDLLYRHPFPGPGLSVRILGEVKAEYIPILQAADAIFMEELRKHNLYEAVSQAFAVFLPVKSVGVKGDARSYEYVIALRAVKTIDFMTADFAELPYEFLGAVARRIMNEVRQVSRVTYDISSKPPATIEWE